MESAPLSRRWLLAVALLAALVRVGWEVQLAGDASPVGVLDRHLLGDERAYDELARHAAAGTLDRSRAFYQEPLYGWLLGQLYRLAPPPAPTGSPAVVAVAPTHQAVVWLQHLFGVLTAVLVASLGARCLGSPAGLLAGAFAALSGPLVFHESMLLKSSLGLLVFTGVLHLWLSLLRDPPLDGAPRSWRRPFLTGLAVGVGILLRGNVYLLAVLMAASLLWRRRVAATVALTLGTLLAVSPVTLHNLRHDDLVLTTYQAGPNVAIGQPDSDDPLRGVVYEPLRAGRGDARHEEADAVALAEQGAGRSLSGREVSSWWWSEARRRVAARPGVSLQRVGLKLLHVFHGKEVGDVKDWAFTRSELGWLSTPLSDLTWLGPLGLLGFLVLPWRRRELLVVRSGVVVVAATLMLFYVMGRYRLTAAPCLWILAAGVLVELTRVWSAPAPAGRRALLTGGALLLVALGNLPLPALALLPDARTGEMEPTHTAWANLASVELALAGEAVTPPAAEAHRERAVAAARRALRDAPEYPGARATLIRALDLATPVLVPRRDEAWLEAWRQLVALEGFRTAQAVEAVLGQGAEAQRDAAARMWDLPSDPERETWVAVPLAFACRRVAQGLRDPGDVELALLLLDRARQLDPDEPEVHLQRGLFLKRAGRLPEAEQAYRTALGAGMDSVALHNNLGNVLLELGRPAEAAAAFRRALALDPDSPVVLKNLLRAEAAGG